MYNPEDVGLMLWRWMQPNADFQDLPSWRELVVATALSLRRHHAQTLIVPMWGDTTDSGRSALDRALSRMDPGAGPASRTGRS